MEEISKVLKKYRKDNQLSVKDVVSLLHERGINVAVKTVYGWESGQASPPVTIFLALCEIYNITDVTAAFSPEKSDTFFHVTHSERILLQAYRKHPEMQKAVNKLLNLKFVRKKGND